MFHNRTSRIAAILLLLTVSAAPMTSLAAQGATAPAPAVQTQQAPTLKETVATKVDDFSLEQLRQDTEAKLSDTKQWVKDQNLDFDLKEKVQTLDTKLDRLQDDIKPSGATLKASLKNMVPEQGLVNMGGRKVSVWGLILAISFGLVLLLLSLAGPNSRLGGRH